MCKHDYPVVQVRSNADHDPSLQPTSFVDGMLSELPQTPSQMLAMQLVLSTAQYPCLPKISPVQVPALRTIAPLLASDRTSISLLANQLQRLISIRRQCKLLRYR